MPLLSSPVLLSRFPARGLPAGRPPIPGRRRTDWEPQRGWKPTLGLAFAVAAADWLSKALIAGAVPEGSFVEVWQGRVALWHVRNPAMVLGLWGNLPLEVRATIAATVAVLAVMLFFHILPRGHRLPPHQRRYVWLFLGLSLGGMLGNLGERALHWGVTDFLSFRWGGHWLPPGNLADVAILLAIPLCVPVILFELAGRRRRRTAAPLPALAAGGATSFSRSRS